MPNELGWLDRLWRRVRGLEQSAAVAVPPRVTLFREFCERPETRTSAELHALLDLWEFDPGTAIAIYLTVRARLRWHQELPEPEWKLVIEDARVLHPDRVERALRAIARLAEVTHIDL